ncbi:PAAR domain-containing protein [Paraburkholderia silviterrae]|uniref:PAAR domain-containing protein n=1 Tax=Paraburkholderia silviterrae TaxID=2528715 RepID=A0A4R5M3U7_9BURK|nr:PAAR domain-containing protein [Paraburkholderia silviterrae]TDG20355.1 PAAR domain-containing protein [Paraburkholderia silviterrae]
MRKAVVRHGDPTTTGGLVVAQSSKRFDNGKIVALDGDEATCGDCSGIFKILGTGKGMDEKNRCAVVEQDLVLCPCGKNRVLVGKNPGIFIG